MKTFVRRIPAIVCGSKVPTDPPAKRYCFRATVKIMFRDTPCGIFTAFDSSVDIGKKLEDTAQKFIEQEGEPLLRAEEVDLAMYLECPVELTGDIYFARLLDFEEDDDTLN